MSRPAVPDLVTSATLPPAGTARLDPAAVPTTLPGGTRAAALVETADGSALLHVPGVARYLVRAGAPVTVAPEATAAPADLACFLAGPVLAAHLLVHGVPSLRATAVRLGDGIVAVTSAPAVGRSTLGAALALRGYPVVADGVLPVVVTAGGVLAWPTTAELVLWPPAARALGLDAATGRPVRPALARRAFRIGAGDDDAGPLPVRAVVTLAVDRTGDRAALRATDRGAARMTVALQHVWHRPLAGLLGRGADLLDLGVTLAGSARFLHLTRPTEPFTATALADLVEDALR